MEEIATEEAGATVRLRACAVRGYADGVSVSEAGKSRIHLHFDD